MPYSQNAHVWGLRAPIDARASWGARGIANWGTLDIPWDRQQVSGEDKASIELVNKLNGGILEKVHLSYQRLADMGEIQGHMANRVTLYEDDEIKVVGDTRASHGYFYLVGWLKEK